MTWSPDGHLRRRAVLAGGAALAVGAATTPAALAAAGSRPGAPQPFGPVALWTPPADRPAPGSLYARAVRLHSASAPGARRTILVTFEQYATTHPVFPVFASDDDGRTWTQRGSVADAVNGWGLRYQPFLYELPCPVGGLPAGTVLCAGNSIPDDLSRTTIDLYASTDRGATWRFLSSVASGGRAVPDNGQTPVWEPFLLAHRGRLVCCYSDQRDPRHGQKLVHQTSSDLLHWGPVVDDVTSDDYAQRPGMPTVAALPDGRWIMTYEGGGGSGTNFFAVHYKIARDPERFASVAGAVLHDSAGRVPSSSPTVVWSPSGGRRGTIVVSAGSDADLFVNRALGDPGRWTRTPSRVPAGYARFTIPLEGARVFTVSGGTIGNTGLNRVVDGVDALG